MVQILSNMIRPVVWSLLLAILVGTISTLSSISLMGLSAWLIASAALQPPLYVLSLAIVRCTLLRCNEGCLSLFRAIFYT